MMRAILKFLRLSLLSVFCCSMHLSNLHAEHTKELTTANGIQYMTGGVGRDEVLAMRPHAKNFSLNLLFSEGLAGQAVTDVSVNIYDENAQLVFRVTHAKPMLYVDLPAGIYTILANNQGNKLRHKINIDAGKPNKVILNWKNEALDTRETSE